MNPNIEAGWEKFLNPEMLKQHLMNAGIYLAAYEMFKQSLVGQPRDFFSNTFRDGEWIPDPEYKAHVLALDEKHTFHASALWWEKHGVLTEQDVKKAGEIREHRDKIAHDMPRFLGTKEGVIKLELLESIFELLTKIDKWWIQQVEIPTDPDFDNRKLTEEDLNGVMSMSMVLLSLMIPIAYGDDSRLRIVYEEWKKSRKG
jgi:hypothetical protein